MTAAVARLLAMCVFIMLATAFVGPEIYEVPGRILGLIDELDRSVGR